uniref:Phylloseptin-2.1TR n=2 Tax=Phyllomedusa TaxID=8392 RepID=PLS21_PHYTB|nr:RecName: Full=Phylloseptin-2.1TR; Short=PLS-2.1TR; AltName: Full=Phylloseptin-2.2TR [Phyllomedusa trinitatis]P84930.1 RecName: Full=Phylloseptin-2; Short=PStar 02 [Phyllomedusa tarsius]
FLSLIPHIATGIAALAKHL